MTAVRVVQIGVLSLAVTALAVARHPRPLAARGADPTFAQDVAPILYQNCAKCHHDGGMAPFSLTNYDDASAHAAKLRKAVAEGQMPPWHAVGPHGMFRNDRRLSDADKQTLIHWVDAGAPAGDLAHAPPAPAFPTQWMIGTPDAIVTMSEDFPVPASGTIEYQYFQVPTGFTEDKWVQAIEVMPGAREVVHHVIVYAAAPPTPAPVAAGAPVGAPPQPVLLRKAADSIPGGPPRTDMRHARPDRIGVIVGAYVPGTSTIEFPPGTALHLRAGTVLTLQVHYTAHGHAMNDRTSIGFRFASAPPAEEIFASYFANGQFTLPAGAKDVPVSAEIGAGRAIRIWGMLPHTHLRGTRWLYELERPDGSSDVVLDVPHYDFNWQTYYMFTTPLEVPAGGKIVSTAWYDNSAANKHNPDPTIDVHWGDQTWEEMQYTAFLYSIARSPVSGMRKH